MQNIGVKGWSDRRAAIVTLVLGLVGVVVLLVLRQGSLVGQWYDRQGRPLPNGPKEEGLVLDVYFGEDHCDWGDIAFMDLAWPIGTVVHESPFRNPNVRQYVRNPEAGHPHIGFPEVYDPDASLPRDAYDTGFHRGDWHVWVSPSQAEQFIYVAKGDRVERWPRSKPYALCA